MEYAGAVLATTAVILQFYLILQNRVTAVPETVVRFFSYFTILTNSLVAICFCSLAFFGHSRMAGFFSRYSVVTAIIVYITLVGLVYQFVLRSTWNPTGMQMVVDELLHSVIPVLCLVYWFLMPGGNLTWSHIPGWMIYPGIYFVLIIIRGSVSGFYPYPFLDVSVLGLRRVLENAMTIVLLFTMLSSVFILLARPRRSGT